MDLARPTEADADTDPPATKWSPPAIRVVADFDDFYRSHRDSVAKALALTLGGAALGAEAADEAMVRAYQRWNDVAGYANPEGWVYRTGLNWARSWLRRMARAATKAPILARAPSVDAITHDPGLELALDELSADQRAVVVLRYLFGFSVAETADALGIKPGTVKSRLHRALAVLAEHPALTNDRDER